MKLKKKLTHDEATTNWNTDVFSLFEAVLEKFESVLYIFSFWNANIDILENTADKTS